MPLPFNTTSKMQKNKVCFIIIIIKHIYEIELNNDAHGASAYLKEKNK